MANLHGLFDSETKELTISNLQTRKLVTKIKYGTIDMLMKMDIVVEKNHYNKLLEGKDIEYVNFSGKIPNNVRRANSIFNFENEILDMYGSYVHVRIDLRPLRQDMFPVTREEYKSFIKDMRNNIRNNECIDFLVGWFSLIEKDSYDGEHVHWRMMFRGDRYLGLSKREANKKYNKDVDTLVYTIRKYLNKRDGNIKYCNINVTDLGDKPKGMSLLIIDKDDYNLRNCFRVSATYLCKDKFKTNGRNFDKSIFNKKNKMNPYNPFYNWVNVLDRLLEYDDNVVFERLLPGLKYHNKRIKSQFELEEEIASKYPHYVMVPFQLKNGIYNEDISLFLKKYNNNRYSNKLFIENEVAYCWNNNTIENDVEFNLFTFFKINPTDHESKHMVSQAIRFMIKWIRSSSDRLSKIDIDEEYIYNYTTVDSSNYVDRNKARYLIAINSVTDNERIDSDVKNIRVFTKSTVR